MTPSRGSCKFCKKPAKAQLISKQNHINVCLPCGLAHLSTSNLLIVQNLSLFGLLARKKKKTTWKQRLQQLKNQRPKKPFWQLELQ